MSNPLIDIEEGMKVIDAGGNEIGTVEKIYMSDEDPETVQPETVTGSDPGPRPGGAFTEILADIFRGEELPEMLRERLQREGFLRLDADGLFASDRYVLPSDISAVGDGKVSLLVTRDDLIRRP